MKGVPPGRKRNYTDIDERCAECVMLGGDEDPCQPKGTLAEIERRYGRPCPRVELDPQNAEVSELVSYVISESLRPLAPMAFEATFGRRRRVARRVALRRLQGAIGHPDVTAALNPEVRKNG